MSFWNLHAAYIESLEVVDTKTLSLSMSEVKMWTGEIVWEMKVLNDMSIAFASQDEENDNVAILTLDEVLEKNTEYSLLTVFGADGSIDFKTGDVLEDIEIINPETDEIGQSIESITLVDVNTIKVTYVEDIEWEELEFKLLSEIWVDGISGVDEDTVNVKLTVDIKSDKNYILMVLALQDALSQDVDLEEGIYDFMAPTEITTISEPTEEVVENTEEVIDETQEVSNEVEDELNAAYNLLEPEESTDLLEKDVEAVVEKAVEEEKAERTLEAVAMSATVTPETGAETWVLIMLTLFINTFYYFSRRKA